MSDVVKPSRCEPGLQPVQTMPLGMHLSDEEGFQPAIHLEIQEPTSVTTLEFEKVAFPYLPESLAVDWPGLAYTAPFRLLSDAGNVKLGPFCGRTG